MNTQVLTCDPANIDESGVCQVPVWQEQSGAFPPLSTSDGFDLAGAIIGVWVLGWAVRQAARALKR